MDCSRPGFPVFHYLLDFALTYVHRVSDAIQSSHPLPPSSPFVFNFSSIRVFSNESALHIRWPKYWSFSFSILPMSIPMSPSNEYSGFPLDGFSVTQRPNTSPRRWGILMREQSPHSPKQHLEREACRMCHSDDHPLLQPRSRSEAGSERWRRRRSFRECFQGSVSAPLTGSIYEPTLRTCLCLLWGSQGMTIWLSWRCGGEIGWSARSNCVIRKNKSDSTLNLCL